jgi:hypothetical protein
MELCVPRPFGSRSEPRFDHRVASLEDRMRKITITVAALALIALTTSFTPHPWSGSPSRTLASISPLDLTLTAKNLTSADHVDAH